MGNTISVTTSALETEKVGEVFGKTLSPGDVVCLYGDLGAGKTTITKGIAKGLGVNTRVISPTFSLVRQYTVERETIKTLYHLDLYRLEDESAGSSIGVQEMLSDPQAVVLIEWPEKMRTLLPEKRIEIHLSHLEDYSRKIIITRIN